VNAANFIAIDSGAAMEQMKFRRPPDTIIDRLPVCSPERNATKRDKQSILGEICPKQQKKLSFGTRGVRKRERDIFRDAYFSNLARATATR
jgi:hypothetical protein